MALQWEELDSRMLLTDIVRTKVPGGWFVLVKHGLIGYPRCLTFYPDPEHKWDGNSLPDDQ